MNYIAIDIGGTSAKIGLLNEHGDIKKFNQYDVRFDNYETPIIDTVVKSLNEFMIEDNIKDIKGICISATGQIDVNKGEVIGTGGNIKNYNGSKFKQKLEEIYKVKTTVINDANAALLGELFLGRAKGYKNIIMITIGTGVGGGIVVNEEIAQGMSGIGGEIGHFSINNKGISCTCGNIGCYEKYASMTSLITRVKDELKIDNINGKEIFEQISSNEQVNKVVDEWIDDVSCGIVSLIHIFNPEMILIGGAVSKQRELFIDKVKEKVELKAMPNFTKNLIIDSAKLGNDAGMVGALYYYLKDGENHEI